MRTALLCLALAAALPAGAQLYKCVAKDGKVAYQAEPCAAAAQESRIKTATPEAVERGPGGVALIDVEQMARRIEARRGRPTVVMLYSTTCSLSQQAFPQMVALAREYRAKGVEFVVLSTDSEKNFDEVPPFVSKAGGAFEPVAIKPWPSGNLKRALGTVGIEIGMDWTRPLVALRDRDGKVVRKGEGVTDLAPLRSALATVTR